MRITLGEWRHLGDARVESTGRLALPTPPTGPGLYRFLLSGSSHSVYVGETEDLPRRFYGYRNPGPSQRTNQRMNQRMLDVLAAGGRVAIEVCTGAVIEVGTCHEPLDLRVKSHRLLAEEGALAAARAEGLGTVENAGG